MICLLLTQEIRSNIPPSPDPQLPLSQTIALLCATKCTLSAQELINIVYDNEIKIQHPSNTKPLPAWWWTAFCKLPVFMFVTFFRRLILDDLLIIVRIIVVIYTAAIALIPARAYAHIRGDIPLASLNEAWRRSVSILDQLSSFSLSASRCTVVLQKLNEAIVPKTQTAATGDIAHTDLKANERVSDHGHPCCEFDRRWASSSVPITQEKWLVWLLHRIQ